MPKTPILLSPRVFLHPSLYKQYLDAYEPRLSGAAAAAAIGDTSQAELSARLNQLGLTLNTDGKYSNRRAKFYVNNPPEQLANIRERLDTLDLCLTTFLASQGRVTQVALDEAQKRIGRSTFRRRPHCSIAGYQATLTACRNTPNIAQASTELVIGLDDLIVRLRDMCVDHRQLVIVSHRRAVEHIEAVQSYLELVAQIEMGPVI